MRALIVGLAILAGACSVETNSRGGHGGYTVDIRAVENSAVYVVTGPDGRVAAARSQNGASAMLDPQALQQALAAMPAPATNPRYDDHEVSIRAPGFSLRASGDDDGAGAQDADNEHAGTPTTTPASGEKPVASAPANDVHGRGHVSMNIGGFSLDAEGDGDEGNGRAHVHFAGLSAHDARHFITDADELSPQVQTQMLAVLGLPQDDK
ncbi:MAG: hypothetical protein WAU68_00420 [Vitreimonas sp.]